jgi:hypothetical protein
MADLVDATGRKTSARILRPAVLALTPAGCQCADQLRSIAAQAHEFGLSTYFIEPKSGPARGPSLAKLSEQTKLTGFRDESGELTALAPKPDRVGLLLVSSDGRLVRAPITYSLGERIEQPLADVK